MAYASKELKAKVALKLKEIMPKGWKYSLSRQNLITLKLTIQSAPVNLAANRFCGITDNSIKETAPEGYADLFLRISKVLNCDNYNNNDLIGGYYDVGYYTEICIGTYDKPFKVK